MPINHQLTPQDEELIFSLQKKITQLLLDYRQVIIDRGITLNDANSMIGTALSLSCFDLDREIPRFMNGLATSLVLMR